MQLSETCLLKNPLDCRLWRNITLPSHSVRLLKTLDNACVSWYNRASFILEVRMKHIVKTFGFR